MSTKYQNVHTALTDYLTTLPEGLQITQHTRAVGSSHFLILHFSQYESQTNQASEQPITSTPIKPVQVKQEPVMAELNTSHISTVTMTKEEPITPFNSPIEHKPSVSHYTDQSEQKPSFSQRTSPWRSHWNKGRYNRRRQQSKAQHARRYREQCKANTDIKPLQLPRLQPTNVNSDINTCIHRLISGTHYR